MVQDGDHIAGATGLSPTVTLSKSGGSFASPSGAVTELANGWYKVAGNATDTATLGPLILHATGTGADPTDVLYEVVAHDVQDAARLGLTALPAGGTLAVTPTLNATQSFNNTGQTTKYAVTLAEADVSGNLPANIVEAEGVPVDGQLLTPTIALEGVVAASPAATATDITVTLDAALDAGTVAADLIGLYLTYTSGARLPRPGRITNAVINSTTSVALTFASGTFAAAPAAGDSVMISG